MRYFEITDKAKEIRLEIEEAICTISEHMGLDEATLNSQAESRLNHSRSNYHLINILFEGDFGGQITLEELTENFSLHQINRMQENGFIDEVDPDLVLVKTAERVFEEPVVSGLILSKEFEKRIRALSYSEKEGLKSLIDDNKNTSYKFKHELLKLLRVL